MEQIHKLEVTNQQKTKLRILKLERYYSIVFFIIILIIAYLSISPFSHIIQNYSIPYILFLLFICFTVMISICQRFTKYQKKKWMNSYGEQITAVVTTAVETRFRPFIHLEWRNPQTEKIHRYQIAVPRYKLKFARRYETGSQFPLWIDPSDPDFYCPDW